jgi:molybdopterin-guanine dinucleotide biosynthesis adapter protein
VRQQCAIAITGVSGTGKTTLIVRLIEQLVREGRSVGAIKHTHHPLNDDDRGDTARFRAAGADPVMLAGDDEAIVDRTARIRYSDPAELLAHFATDVVLIEGFKGRGPWPRFEASETAIAEVLSKIASS